MICQNFIIPKYSHSVSCKCCHLMVTILCFLISQKKVPWSIRAPWRVALFRQFRLPKANLRFHGSPLQTNVPLRNQWTIFFCFDFLALSPVSPEDFVSSGVTRDGEAQASKTNKKCRESTFRSVTDLSSGGEKTTGLDTIDLVLVFGGSTQILYIILCVWK